MKKARREELDDHCYLPRSGNHEDKSCALCGLLQAASIHGTIVGSTPPQITMHEYEPRGLDDYCVHCGHLESYFRHGKLPQDSTPEGWLRELYPHGHPDFLPKLIAEAKLHSDKNKDYAGGGDPLGNFTRVAAICALYPGLTPSNPATVALIYALKQIDQIFWSLSRGYEGNIEGIEGRAQDVSVYFKLADILHKEYGTSLSDTVPI